MDSISSTRIVLDTNVVFEGLTNQGSACSLIIDAWFSGVLSVCLSTALVYEYEDVLSRKLSDVRWKLMRPLLVSLVNAAQFTPIYFSWRPSSPDPGDDLVIDCAMNAGAIVITSNTRDFRQAQKSLGLSVMTPAQLIAKLLSKGDRL